jgi:uncharacterized RDD family membrane protein YckC
VVAQAPAVMTGPVVARTVLAYAGFWRRLAAYIVDASLLVGIEIVLASSISVLEPNDFEALANVAPVSAALWWAYFAILESSPAQGTLGKIAFDMRVTDLHGDPVSFRRAFFRHFAKYLSSLIFGAGWFLAAFTPRKQALHDLVAGTLVLRKVRVVVAAADAAPDLGDQWDGSRWVATAATKEKA